MDRYSDEHREFLLVNHPRGQQLVDEHDQFWANQTGELSGEDEKVLDQEKEEEDARAMREEERQADPTSSPESSQTWEDQLSHVDEEPEPEDEAVLGEEDPYNTWDSSELRKECKARGLETKGTKSQMVARLEKDDRDNPED